MKGILQAWAKKGITSVEAAKAEQAEFRQSKLKRKYSYAAGTEEVVPDWFKGQKRKEKWKQEQKQEEQESQDPAV